MMVLVILLVVFQFPTRKVEIERTFTRLHEAEWCDFVMSFDKKLASVLFYVENEVVFVVTHAYDIGELLNVKEGHRSWNLWIHSLWQLKLSDHLVLIEEIGVIQELGLVEFYMTPVTRS